MWECGNVGMWKSALDFHIPTFPNFQIHQIFLNSSQSDVIVVVA
jgi:hypothetical protein